MKFTYAILAALAFGYVSAQAPGCNCKPEDTDCISKCVTGTNDCVTQCKNDTDCFQKCVQGWPGVGETPVPSSPAATDAPVPSGSAGPSQPSGSPAPSGSDAVVSPGPSGGASDSAPAPSGTANASGSSGSGPSASPEASGDAVVDDSAAGRVQASAFGLSAVAVVAALAL